MNKAPPPEEISDEEYVRLSLEDPNRFGTLVLRYEIRLKRFLVRLFPSLNAEDIRELVQDSFIQAYKHLNDFEPDLKFSNWLYRITRNQAISSLRKTSKIRLQSTEHHLSEDCCAELYSPLLVDANTAELKLDQAQQAQLIRKWIQELPVKYREPFILKFLEDKDYNEISDILQIPIGTVGTLIHRAKNDFKAAFKERGNHEF